MPVDRSSGGAPGAGDRTASSPVARTLTIAGSDSGGGAGIQADLKTFAVLGTWGMSAITAVTVQNTRGVSGFTEVPPEVVDAQIRAVAGDIGVDAAKTGMLASAPIVEAVARALEDTAIPLLVVDPVFVSKHGDPLLRREAVEALAGRIVPLASLVTPNLPEASGLVGFEVASRSGMERAADAIVSLGAGAVLLKGGHLPGPASDDLFVSASGEREWLEAERIDSVHTHGTGCVLSASITARLAIGDALADAVRAGKEFVTEAIRHGLAIGGGIGPVDPGWRLRPDGGARTGERGGDG